MQVVRQPIAEQPDRGHGPAVLYSAALFQVGAGVGKRALLLIRTQGERAIVRTASQGRQQLLKGPGGSQGVQPRLRFRVVQAFTNVVCLDNRRSHQGTQVGLFPAPAGHIVSVQ